MSGLNFSLGGKLDPSFKSSLDKAEAEAKAAGLRIQTSLRAQISGIDKQLAKADPRSAEASALAMRKAHLANALLIAQNGQYVAAAKRRIALQEAESAAAQATTGHIAGLNLVIRESIVLLREWGRGNYARMPGSASIIAQGLAQMGATGKAIAFLNKPLFNSAAAQAEGAAAGKAGASGIIGALSSIPLVAMGLVAGSLAALIAAPIIYFHRVKKLAGELTETLASAFKPEHIAGYLGKLEILNQLQKDVADSARQIQEAHDSVSSTMDRELALTKDRIAYERELLEIQKANALASAKNPAEREAIEKAFSQKILANKKEERDAELVAMKKEAQDLPKEIEKTQNEIKGLTEGDYVTEARDRQILEMRKKASEAYDDYRKQLPPGEKDKRDYSADKDRKLIARLTAKQNEDLGMGFHAALSDSEEAELKAARARLANAADSEKSLNEWMDAGDARERARLRVKELENRVKADSDRLAKLAPGQQGGLIADTARKNLQRDKEELALEQERLKRVEAGTPFRGREVTERERIGIGSPQMGILDVNRSMDRKLAQLVALAQRKSGGSAAATLYDPLGPDHF